MSESEHAPAIGIATVGAQEQLPKPVLLPSSGLGGWLRQVGGSLAFTTYQSSRIFFLYADEAGGTAAQDALLAGIERPYTQGFREPHRHRGIMHAPTDVFPVAPPCS